MLGGDGEQQLHAESLMHESQNEEAESMSEYREYPRWSSLDSINPILGEEQISYNLPASNAVPDTTFTVEVDSLGSYTLPTGLLDPKTALTIAYDLGDLDDSAGIQKDDINLICNETFNLEGSEDISVSGVHCFDSSSAEALSPVVFRPESSYTDPCYSEAECHYRCSSEKNDAKLKRSVSKYRSDMFPEFETADGELKSSPSFRLDGDCNIASRTMCVTSTPLASPAANSLDTVLTVKPARHSTERGCPEHVPTARRMLQMFEDNNSTKDCIIGKYTSEKFRNSDVNILDSSLDISSSEQDSDNEVFTGA